MGLLEKDALGAHSWRTIEKSDKRWGFWKMKKGIDRVGVLLEN
jgi:hypothetical protein